MVVVLGLVNNISYGPQSGGGGGILYLGGGVVAVSKYISVTEKTAVNLSQSCCINKV